MPLLGKLNDNIIDLGFNSNCPNRNVFIAGGPGSFKSAGYVIPNIIAEQHSSIVLTDPKGEIYEQTSEIKRLQGYNVRVVNFKSFLNSDRYNFIDYVEKDGDANDCAYLIISSVSDPNKTDVWFKTSKDLLKALILYIKYEYPPKKRNMKHLLNFLLEHKAFSDDPDDPESELDKEFMKLDENHPARKSYILGFKQSESKTRSSVLLSFTSDISSFVEEDIQSFTSESDFFLNEIGKNKTIVYVMLPVLGNSHSALTGIFFRQMFKELYKLGDYNNSKLPQPVDFYLDEFPNIGKITDYEEFLATCRGYGIGVTTIVQSLSQLYDKYGKEKAEAILGNHATKLCLGNVNKSTAKYFEEELSTTTVEYETSGSSSSSGKDSKSSSESTNVAYTGRNLMNVDEIATMPRDIAILLTDGLHPIKIEKLKHFELFPNLTDKFKVSQMDYQSIKAENVKEWYKAQQDKWNEENEKRIQESREKQIEELEKKEKESMSNQESHKENDNFEDSLSKYKDLKSNNTDEESTNHNSDNTDEELGNFLDKIKNN